MVAEKTIRNAFTTGICAAILLGLLASSGVSAAPAAAGSAVISEQTLMKQLSLLEDRFFLRQYANDPIEKRLERLELLVFGATQDGTNPERWARLNNAIATRGKTLGTAGGAGTKSGAKPPETSSQYPVLNTLEWRALKKTYPNETLDQRLARVEQKLFGQDSPGMPYFDRVERLKRTLGVGVTAAAPTGPLGPAPKARPRGSGGGMTDPFAFGAPQTFGLGTPGTMMPDLFGDPNAMRGFNSAFAQIFEDMNRQMAELNNLGLPPGAWVYDNKTGEWVEQSTGKRQKAGQGGSILPKQIAPSVPSAPRILPQYQFKFRQQQQEMDQLPPYADPNSI